jgi:hypothetical protein
MACPNFFSELPQKLTPCRVDDEWFSRNGAMMQRVDVNSIGSQLFGIGSNPHYFHCVFAPLRE